MDVAVKVEQFGKYTILGRIAAGGMASVFLGRERMEGGQDRWVAVKRVHPHLVSRKDVVQMFLNEAKLLSQLDHKNISGILDFGMEGESPYIVMRYLHGAPLSGLIRKLLDKKDPLPIDMMAFIAASTCDGLHYAHEAHGETGDPLGLVHRDISPQNIFITIDGEVSLLDFGVAKAAGFTGFTRTGHIKGKYAYMSPEQVAAATLDRRSDVFSLGIVLWESLTGRHLFRRKQHIETLRAIARADVPAVSEYNLNVPPMLEAIVARALVADRRLRYQTAKAMGADLWSYLAQQDVRMGPEQLTQVMKATYPDMKHPAALDGTEDTRRLEIAAEAQALEDEPEAEVEAQGVIENPLGVAGIADASIPLDDPAFMSIPDLGMPIAGVDDGQPLIQTQPDGLSPRDSLLGTLRPDDSSQHSDVFAEKTIAMGAIDRLDLEATRDPDPDPSSLAHTSAEFTPADPLAAPTVSLLGAQTNLESAHDATIPLKIDDPLRKTDVEFEDGTEVQLLNPTAPLHPGPSPQSAPRISRPTDATLRDVPLDPSERALIERATRNTLVDSPIAAIKRTFGPSHDPLVVDPAGTSSLADRDTAFKPRPIGYNDTQLKSVSAPTVHGREAGRPQVRNDPRPEVRPRRDPRNTWPEMVLVVVAAASIGALVYTVVLRYFTRRQSSINYLHDPKKSEGPKIQRTDAIVATSTSSKIQEARDLAARAKIAVEAGDSKAELELLQCVRLADLAECHLMLGKLYENKNEAKSIEHYRRYLTLDPKGANLDAVKKWLSARGQL